MNNVKIYDIHGEPCTIDFGYFVKKSEFDAALAEIENWKQGSKIEADAGDEARREVAALRKYLANVKRSRADELENYNAMIDDLTAAEQRNAELEQSVELHAQVIRDQEQLIQNHRLVNEKLEIEVQQLHAVIQRLNAARRPVRTDVSGGATDRQVAGISMRSVLMAWDSASKLYLPGTSNWCAHVAADLSKPTESGASECEPAEQS